MIDKDRLDARGGEVELLEVILNVGGSIAAAQFDQRDGLAADVDAGGEAVESSNLVGVVGEGGGAGSEGSFGCVVTKVGMGDGTVVESEDSGDGGSVLLGNLDGADAAAIAALGMLVLVELDAEGLFHVGGCAGKRDGAAQGLIAAFQDLQIVFAGKLANLVDVGGVCAIGAGELLV